MTGHSRPGPPPQRQRHLHLVCDSADGGVHATVDGRWTIKPADPQPEELAHLKTLVREPRHRLSVVSTNRGTVHLVHATLLPLHHDDQLAGWSLGAAESRALCGSLDQVLFDVDGENWSAAVPPLTPEQLALATCSRCRSRYDRMGLQAASTPDNPASGPGSGPGSADNSGPASGPASDSAGAGARDVVYLVEADYPVPSSHEIWTWRRRYFDKAAARSQAQRRRDGFEKDPVSFDEGPEHVPPALDVRLKTSAPITWTDAPTDW